MQTENIKPANSIRTIFCGIDTVSCLAGLSHSRVYELVESGYYLWVWNVSSGRTGRRELRFWTREISRRASVSRLTLDDVLKFIIPQRAHLAGQFDGLRNWELRHLLRISKTSLCKMRRELGMCGTSRNLLIPRANLERFFRRRWCGNFTSSRGQTMAKPCKKGGLPVNTPAAIHQNSKVNRRRKFRRRIILRAPKKLCEKPNFAALSKPAVPPISKSANLKTLRFGKPVCRPYHKTKSGFCINRRRPLHCKKQRFSCRKNRQSAD